MQLLLRLSFWAASREISPGRTWRRTQWVRTLLMSHTRWDIDSSLATSSCCINWGPALAGSHSCRNVWDLSLRTKSQASRKSLFISSESKSRFWIWIRNPHFVNQTPRSESGFVQRWRPPWQKTSFLHCTGKSYQTNVWLICLTYLSTLFSHNAWWK